MKDTWSPWDFHVSFAVIESFIEQNISIDAYLCRILILRPMWKVKRNWFYIKGENVEFSCRWETIIILGVDPNPPKINDIWWLIVNGYLIIRRSNHSAELPGSLITCDLVRHTFEKFGISKGKTDSAMIEPSICGSGNWLIVDLMWYLCAYIQLFVALLI